MARDPATQRFAAQNRKARHDYLIEDTIEAGMMLTGSEVKSLRLGRASINEAFAAEKNGEFFLYNSHFPEYAAANQFNHQPRRARKLLLRKREINKLMGATQRAGITVIPLSIYFNDRGIAKVQLGLAKGKRKVDKREAEKERDWKREQSRLMSHRGRE
ncbi:MAG TPA: SsrA-binding protein SmpB [Dongiaceae bacterium]|jgi:SsrA-binding protein|nr:SsrA-binding protein SmpB [Dongiaceae bacterium]